VRSTSSCSITLLAVRLSLVIACGGSAPVPSDPPPRVPSGEASSEKPAAARPVFSNCRLGSFRFASAGHDENASGGPRRSGTSEPSCAINADCIAQQGRTAPGDGAVVMECANGNCSCRLEALSAPNTVVEFDFAAVCSTPEVMQQLIREHCLAGMDVKASSQLSAETPGEPPAVH
jgi:hypothetical protein